HGTGNQTSIDRLFEDSIDPTVFRSFGRFLLIGHAPQPTMAREEKPFLDMTQCLFVNRSRFSGRFNQWPDLSVGEGSMWRNVIRAFIFLYLTWTAVWAQSTAQLSGTVKDQSGAVLPGVEVKATQTSTGLERSVLTNETGSYILPNLPIGP